MLAATLVVAAAGPAVAGHWLAPHAGARVFLDEPFDLAPLPDLLQVVIRDRELLAIDGYAGGVVRQTLGVGEQVQWSGSRGRVAVVLTNRRILAVTTISPSWAATDVRLAEEPPRAALLGARVALVLTDQRAIGFEAVAGTLVETELAPREQVIDAAVDLNVAVVVTNRRALGVAAFGGGFSETEIGPREPVDGLTTRADFATVATRHQLLIFRAPSATWQRRDLSLR